FFVGRPGVAPLGRHSSSHSGSFFFCEISRTISSLSPFGIVSVSTSVTKPYLYSRFASCSIVSVDVDMSVVALRAWGARGLRAAGPERYTLKLVPHPHELFAFGLLKMNPLLTRLVS